MDRPGPPGAGDRRWPDWRARVSDIPPENDTRAEAAAAADSTDRAPVPDLPAESADQDEPVDANPTNDSADAAAEAGGDLTTGRERVPDLPPEPAEQRGAIDSSGFRTTNQELDYAGVSADEYENLQRGEAPLGMTPAEYGEFRSELDTALADDGLSDADARLQGTAATFYSRNPSKEFFADGDAIRAEADSFREEGLSISPESEQSAVDRYQQFGYDENPHPRDKVFDQDYAAFGDEAQLSEEQRKALRSDYDVQISSDQLDARMREFQAANPDEPCIADKGGHWRDQPIRDTCPATKDWADRWSDRTGREVNLAGFAGSGPEGPSAFRDDDWVITARRSPEDPQEE